MLMMFELIIAIKASDEGNGLTEFRAGSDWMLYNELHCSFLSEEAEKSGTYDGFC